MTFSPRLKNALACTAIAAGVGLAAGVPGEARAEVENTAKCYRLSDFDYLQRRMKSAVLAKQPLTLTIVVVDDDVNRVSGPQSEWEDALKAAMTMWTDTLRQLMAPDLTIPSVTFVFGDVKTYPAYDIRLVIHADNVFTAPGVPLPTNGNAQPKFDAFVTPDPETGIRPVINVFQASQNWKATSKYRQNVQKTLLRHEAGHAWQLRDIYDNTQLEGNRQTVRGYENCTANIMYTYRETFGAGDKAGLKAAFLAVLQDPLRNAADYPGTPSGRYEDGRWWVDANDPILDSIVSGPAAGYILDGWGGISPFGGAPPLNTSGAPYWGGWDIARALTVLPDASGGWILDGWGGIHNFGSAPPLPTPAYWPNWDIARDLVVLASPRGGYMGYVLDGWGGIHPFNDAPTFPQQNQRLLPGQYSASMVYHAGQDSAVGLMMFYDTPTYGATPAYPTGGIVLERNGVMTRFGMYGVPGDYHDYDPRIPALSRAVPWKKYAVVASGGFYAVGPADASRGLQTMLLLPIGSPDPIVVPNYWGNWDIVRDVVPFKAGCAPRTDPNCLQ